MKSACSFVLATVTTVLSQPHVVTGSRLNTLDCKHKPDQNTVVELESDKIDFKSKLVQGIKKQTAYVN